MTEWKPYPEVVPTVSGIYRVMVAGDSERDGAHVFYEFDDYENFATYSLEHQSFKGEHDEEDSMIIGWFGPIVIPKFDAR